MCTPDLALIATSVELCVQLYTDLCEIPGRSASACLGTNLVATRCCTGDECHDDLNSTQSGIGPTSHSKLPSFMF